MYDIIIVGTGVSGLSAAMYSGRFGLKTLVLGSQPGGLITATHLVENYPGIQSIPGPDMGEGFIKHAEKFGAEIKYETVKRIEKAESFKVKTEGGEYEGKTVILATGTDRRKLNAPGEKEFTNKGISYCGFCDAAFFKNKIVGVVGGGDSALEDVIVLSPYASKIIIFVRGDKFRAEPVLVEKIKADPKVETMFGAEIASVKGDAKLTGVTLKSGKEIALEGLFVAIGAQPLSQLAKDLGVALNDFGYIKVSRECTTNIPGVFAAGDVTDSAFKQVIIGASEGVYAAYSAYKFIRK